MSKLSLATAFVILGCLAASAEEVGGYTNLYFDAGHGTQVEYLTREGQSFLWYPGNRVILEGRWKEQGREVCFAYGANTFNPVTGNSGGAWECTPAKTFWSGITERAEGDVLGLAERNRAPFRLTPERTTLKNLAARVGK